MKTILRTVAGLLLGLGPLLLASCGPSAPAAADPNKSKEVLQTALDAWKQGDKPESLRGRSPAIHASDPDWLGGVKLERYEIKEGEGTSVGYDFNIPVTLWLRAGSGNAKPRQVRYTIGTGSSLVVVRDMGG